MIYRTTVAIDQFLWAVSNDTMTLASVVALVLASKIRTRFHDIFVSTLRGEGERAR